MSFILDYKNWTRLFEQAGSADISNVKSKAGFAGATPSTTSNTSALESFKAGLPNAVIIGEMAEDKALIRSANSKSTLSWTVGEKTVTAKNYIKFGTDIILNGDSGKPTAITVTGDDFLNKPIEASGNGIYVLGRALLLRSSEKLTGQSKIIIGLNTKTANSFVANANTAFQGPIGNFAQAALFTFIVSKAVVPSAGNTTNNVTTAKNLALKPDANPYKWVNQEAKPSVPSEYWERLYTVSPIDSKAFVDKIKAKQIATYTPELTGYVTEFTNVSFEPFITAYAERFKSFLQYKALEAGIDSSLFQDLFSYIDEWKTGQIAKKQAYSAEVTRTIQGLFALATTKGSVTQPAASAAGKVIKGTEGKIGQ
ncbi:hypothetical protein UFOVP1247_230 [uncultured Caudovirales phage]|uniref:Uncharacterized protein n=1 Tax=uncultured Caudovirales phage TaxID=2100421 RepID=A0A6J5Q7N4_9CAUD|nr:hypothetical protein UFOVP970_270 [uncultured Caudovirales phage]CAB4193859.1 hypothetical protein UFOVP1247_230 [uncultured Caudovirales phage]